MMAQERNLVYICSPLNAPTQEGIETNMKKAAGYCRKLEKLMELRCIAPHAFLPAEREVGLKFGIEILKISSAIVVCGNVVSRGMAAEIEIAAEEGIPTFYYHEIMGMAVLSDSLGNETCLTQTGHA